MCLRIFFCVWFMGCVCLGCFIVWLLGNEVGFLAWLEWEGYVFGGSLGR